MEGRQESIRKLRLIIFTIARREPFIGALYRRFLNSLEILTPSVIKSRIKFLLGFSTLSTVVILHKNGLLSRDMIPFLGRCLKKRKQQNRQLVSCLMFEYNCYQGEFFFEKNFLYSFVFF